MNRDKYIYRPNNYRQQGGQVPNIEAAIQPNQTDGDVIHFGNHIWEGYYRDSMQKRGFVADTGVIDTYTNQMVFNRYEYGIMDLSLRMKIFGTGGTFTSNSGAYVAITGGGPWTVNNNYLCTNAANTTNAGIVITTTGFYRARLVGRLHAASNTLTDARVGLFTTSLGIQITGGTAHIGTTNFTALPVVLDEISLCTAGDTVQPRFQAALSGGAGTVSLQHATYVLQLIHVP